MFQPVSFDQLTTMCVLFLALRLARSPSPLLWPLLGIAVGIGVETKYTVAPVVAILLGSFAVLRRDEPSVRSVGLAALLAAVIAAPNLVWQLDHGWASVHFFVDSPPSASDESRLEYIVNLLLLTGIAAVPLVVAGLRLLWRDRVLRPFAVTVVGVDVLYLVAGGKSYYALPVMLFAVAAGAVPFERWVDHSRRRLAASAGAFALVFVVLLPVALPVLPVGTAKSLGVLDARSDYRDELGWPQLMAAVKGQGSSAEVIVASNYGEAGALVVLGSGLPPVVSGHLSFRYWAPDRSAHTGLAVGFSRDDLEAGCSRFGIVGRVRIPHDVDNDEQGALLATCTFRGGSLAAVWPGLVSD